MDYLAKVKDKEGEFGQLFTRMDDSRDLLHLTKYEMKDAGGKKKVPDIVNVTLNRPAVFFANIVSALGNTSEQVIVTSNDKEFDTREVEEFRNAGFATADYRRRNRTRLDDFLDIQNCARGRSAARCLFRMVNGILISDITPWDTRYTTYELAEEGLEWGGYKTRRQKDAIEAEYPELKGKVRGKTALVLDIWDATHNEVWVDGEKVFEQGHDYGFTPVCVEIVPLGYGSVLMDDDRLKYDGEDIFFLIRDAIPELNRLASIMQTLNLKTIKRPMKQKKRGGSTSSEPSSHEELTGIGRTVLMEVDEDVSPIDFGDAQRSAQLAYNMIDRDMEQGSISSIDLGTLQFQLSAVALIEIGEGRDQVFLPRLQAKAGLKEQLGDMFTKQVIQIGGSVELGTPGHKRTFITSNLNGEYDTSYKYFVKSPKIDMARHSVANAAIYVSKKYKMEHMLQLEDPKGEEQQMTIEQAEETSPILRLDKQIRALLDADMDYQAELLSEEMGVAIDSLMRGEIEPTDGAPAKPQQMPNLFGGPVGMSGEASSAKKAADLQRTPEGEGE